MKSRWPDGLLIIAGLLQVLLGSASQAQAQQPSLDARVAEFLESHRHRWNALNVPLEDGKILHDLVRAGRFRNILEIGTSTGHSTRIYAKEVSGFLDYVRAKPNYRTRIERGSGEGISVSGKTAP